MKKKTNSWSLSIFRPGDYSHKMERFNLIHRIIKSKIIHPFLTFVSKKFGKHLINSVEGIPATWFNTHQRIFFDSFDKGLMDMWLYTYRDMWNEKRYKGMSEEEYLKELDLDNNISHKNRMNIIKCWITYILEDSIDRDWLNFSMLRMYHAMHEYYDGNVPKPEEYPRYASAKEYFKEYHEGHIIDEVWFPNEN